MGAMIDGPSGPKKRVVTTPDISALPVEVEPPVVEAGQPVVASSHPQWTERQVGGNHYRKLRIQPLEYILANKLGFPEGNIVKLVTRFRDKGGLEDLDKLVHYAQVLREEFIKEQGEQQ